LDRQRQAAVEFAFPDFIPFAGVGPWYEEDCDWAVVALVFAEHFDGRAITSAISGAKWAADNASRPDQWKQVVRWLNGDGGLVARGKADFWLAENAGRWQAGSMSSRRSDGKEGWAVHFRQIGSEATRWVDMPGYPVSATYSTEDLDAMHGATK
jgi:hypothetical protein